MNLAKIEKRDRIIRRKEYAREDLLKTIKQDSLLKSNQLSDRRVDSLRNIRELKSTNEILSQEAEYQRVTN